MAAFRPGWRMTVFTLLMLPVVISLGFWQVDRGAEKRAMETDYLDELTALPVPVARMDPTRRFQRVRLNGQFTDEVFLVDNQVHKGQPGYWVVQVFEDVSGQRYLTNRGFVPAPALRENLPVIETPSGQVQLVGTIWPYTGLIPLLDEDVWADGWPKRVQRLDAQRMAQEVGAVAVEVRLEPGQPGVVQAAPFARVLSDARHLGYAATWFGLALVLSVGYVVFGFRRR